LSSIEHDDTTNELEVEITNLDPMDENSKFSAIRLIAHSLLTKIGWQQARSSAQRVLLLCIMLFVPLMIGTSYNTRTQSIAAVECVRQQSKIVYVSDETITSTGTTITIITFTTQPSHSSQNGSVVSGTAKVASSTCK